jgi:hypothetical protein
MTRSCVVCMDVLHFDTDTGYGSEGYWHWCSTLLLQIQNDPLCWPPDLGYSWLAVVVSLSSGLKIHHRSGFGWLDSRSYAINETIWLCIRSFSSAFEGMLAARGRSFCVYVGWNYSVVSVDFVLMPLFSLRLLSLLLSGFHLFYTEFSRWIWLPR